MARPGRPRAATPANIESVTKDAVAELLACSVRHVERLIDRGDLEAWRSGRAVRIWLRSVLAYQEANRVHHS
jgi:excisionase family DNA binding protein